LKAFHFFNGFCARLLHSPALMLSTSLAMLLVLASITLVMQWAQQDKEQYFIRPVSHQVDSIQQALNQSALPLKSIAGLYGASQYVDPSEFAHFTGPMMSSLPAIKMLGWVEKIHNRSDFNAKLKKAKLTLEPSQQQRIKFVKGLQVYYPLMYVHPHNTSLPTMDSGLDLGGNKEWLMAMDKARDSSFITIVKERSGGKNLLAFYPVYENKQPINTVAQRRSALKGFALGLYSMMAIMEGFNGANNNFSFMVRDIEHRNPQPFYISQFFVPSKLSGWQQQADVYSLEFNALDRQWLLTAKPHQNGLAFQYMLIPLLAIMLAFLILAVHLRQILLSEANDEKQQTLNKLLNTQHKLVESEKMAALGGLVVGVAHELNTPIGISFTSASHLKDMLDNLQNAVAAQSLNKNTFNKYIENSQEAMALLLTNMNRASELISRFKRISVDQIQDDIALVDLEKILNDILAMHTQKIHACNVAICLKCPNDYKLNSYPMLIVQVLSSLIENALLHAFGPGDTHGLITITVTRKQAGYLLRFEDNGQGINEADLNKIFEPFFTTRRSSGGGGLGLHIAYNLVTNKLNGTIEYGSTLGQGTWFNILLFDLKDKKLGATSPQVE